MKKILLLIAIVGLLIGCSSNDFEKLSDIEKYKMANNYYEQGEYRKAIPIYESITRYVNSKYTVDAQEKLANCYYELEEYEDAKLQYQLMMRFSSDLKDLEIAYFRIGKCFWETSEPASYTQDETLSAISSLEEYLTRYPTGEHRLEAREIIKQAGVKLLEKTYLNGYLYYMLPDYPAALMYFSEVLAAGQENEYDAKSAYYSALIYHKQGLQDKATQYAEYLKAMYPDNKLSKKIDNKID
jgi:outer membrane protein assembly factor BamD